MPARGLTSPGRDRDRDVTVSAHCASGFIRCFRGRASGFRRIDVSMARVLGPSTLCSWLWRRPWSRSSVLIV